LALATVAPVLWWNATHGWVSFLKQGSRVGVWSPERAPQYLVELIGGQIAVATPLIFMFCAAGLTLAARSAWRSCDPARTLLAVVSLLPALIFVQHALGDRVQANWPAIVYPTAAVAAAGLSGEFWRRLRIPAIALGLFMTGAAYVQAAFTPFALPSKLDPVALQMTGWHDLAAAVEDARRRAGASFVAADQYGLAAELAHDYPPAAPVIAIGRRWSSFNLPPAAVDGTTGVLVERERHSKSIAEPFWRAANEIGTVARERDGVVIESYRLFRVVPDHLPGSVRLPRPPGD
jgi:hypothetical protein